VGVDTTVQPETVAFPTDARLMGPALIEFFDRQGLRRQVAPELSAGGKHALILVGRRATCELRFGHAARLDYPGRTPCFDGIRSSRTAPSPCFLWLPHPAAE